MANSKRKQSGKHGPKEDRIGRERPTRFEEDTGFQRSWKKLARNELPILLAQLKEFKKDWLNKDISGDDLNKTWDYKALQGASKKSGVMQIRLSRHRIALMTVGGRSPCVWFLEIFGRASSNKKDIDAAVERAQRIRREQE